ncbi:MAG TPA: pyridoxamine 5'-phosphate oxidase family protein [Acidimicrobiales bacterium]
MAEPRAERPHMPDYGVDTPAWTPLPWSWAAERLAGKRNYWVVTVSGDGRPHALPVWGVWDDDEARFAFSCAPRARKARNLAANPRAVVATDDTVECVSVEGRAAPVRDDERQARWIERYLAKYRPVSPGLDADFLRGNLVVEFEPERAFAVIEREDEFSTRATRWVFAT